MNIARQAVAGCKSALETLDAEAAGAAARAAESAQAFNSSVIASGFADEAEYLRAKRTPDEIAALDKQIKAYDQAVHSAQDRLERARQASKSLAQPNLPALEAAWTLAKRHVESTIRDEEAQRNDLVKLEGWVEELGGLAEELNRREKRYAILGRIAEVANGKNPLNLTFQRFVLSAKLDDVLREASKRLLIMSEGRFFLRIAGAPLNRRASGGLDLEVSDTWTDETRPVKTLSGGESFYTSLALALGLADVVQAYSGGIRLDTIFIDEGFGSLDSDKLDRAIQTLEDLKEGGRLVAIISHVDSLQERVPARLEVSIGLHGSTARFVLT